MKGEYSLCIANNICTASKGMKIAPDAKLNDGLIDVILINSKVWSCLFEKRRTPMPPSSTTDINHRVNTTA